MADQDKTQTDLPPPVAPPPFFFGGALFIGFLLQWLVPLARWRADWLPLAGFAVALAGLAFAVWGFRTLKAAKTTIHVHKVSSALVDGGPYGHSRNPLYVSLIMLYLGISLGFGMLWPVLVLVPATILVQVLVIQREEVRLESWFGQDYLDYKARVRRWL